MIVISKNWGDKYYLWSRDSVAAFTSAELMLFSKFKTIKGVMDTEVYVAVACYDKIGSSYVVYPISGKTETYYLNSLDKSKYLCYNGISEAVNLYCNPYIAMKYGIRAIVSDEGELIFIFLTKPFDIERISKDSIPHAIFAQRTLKVYTGYSLGMDYLHTRSAFVDVRYKA